MIYILSFQISMNVMVQMNVNNFVITLWDLTLAAVMQDTLAKDTTVKVNMLSIYETLLDIDKGDCSIFISIYSCFKLLC